MRKGQLELVKKLSEEGVKITNKKQPAKRKSPFKSVKAFIRAMSARKTLAVAATVFSVQCLDVFPANGAPAQRGIPHHNVPTDTATGFSNRRDWQAQLMGGGASGAFATATGAATASTATSLTNSGATFPTAGNGLAGQWVVCWISTTVMVYGRIVANTATVLTVDQWYSATSTTGAAGTTPASTAPYVVLPGGPPAEWMGLSTAAAGTSADTALSSELTTLGFSRAIGTYAHTHAATTYTLIHLWTCSGGAGTTINSEAQFGGATGGAAAASGGGVMPFESSEPTPPTLLSGDTIQNTVTITIN